MQDIWYTTPKGVTAHKLRTPAMKYFQQFFNVLTNDFNISTS